MKILSKTAKDDLATVYVAEFAPGRQAEFAESVQPPRSRDQKWVLIVSTLFGCPVRCRMCDAGGNYTTRMSAQDILAQIDFLVRSRYPDARVPASLFKIQFARMGEPAFNPHVLDVLRRLPGLYDNHAELVVSVSTIAPRGCDRFFADLLDIKHTCYLPGQFQMQFSIHTTDPVQRDWLIPTPKWDFPAIAAFGEKFYRPADRKITLNFALAQGMPLEPGVLSRYFDPEKFLIKLTPLNPTYRAAAEKLHSYLDPADPSADPDNIVHALRQTGYDVIVSIGEVEENRIGSNCGQYLAAHQAVPSDKRLADAYPLNSVTAP